MCNRQAVGLADDLKMGGGIVVVAPSASVGPRYRSSRTDGDGVSELELSKVTQGVDLEEATHPEKGDTEKYTFLEGDERHQDVPSDLSGESRNIALLLLLYTLQGIPMGLSAVLPLILKERGVSYSDLATFSLNSYPFSLKLLWAPIVDVAYFKTVGLRKTWLVPTQLLIGVMMLGMSLALDDLLFVEKPAVGTLTVIFFFLYLLCATQDIAVDGWALTMLRPENVSYAATCNSVGQVFGYSLGFTGFMMLQHMGLATLADFMFFWGVVFVSVTFAVAILKKEKATPPDEGRDDILSAYSQMVSILRLRSVRALMLILFTWKVGFSTIDGVAALKFQELGIPKEHMAYMTSILMPVYIALPVVVSRWTASGRPFNLAVQVIPWRTFLVPCFAILVAFTPATTDPIPWGFYSLVFLISFMAVVASQCMFVSTMAFFASVSDPAFGGTYMTLLNTISNLGGMWPATVTMKLVDVTTCQEETCLVKTDGFYVMSVTSLLLGAAWYFLMGPLARRVQLLKPSEWKVS